MVVRKHSARSRSARSSFVNSTCATLTPSCANACEPVQKSLGLAHERDPVTRAFRGYLRVKIYQVTLADGGARLAQPQ